MLSPKPVPSHPLSFYNYRLLSETDPVRLSVHPSTCAMVPGLSSRQKELCTRYPEAMKYLGLRIAINECQQAFRNQIWNCTLTARGVGTAPLKIASKESAFVYAISSAGVSHALAKACVTAKYKTLNSIFQVLSFRALMNLHNNRVGRRLLASRMGKECKCHGAVKNDLVFLDASPNYCNVDTRGRDCGDNCRKICCGRGWHTEINFYFYTFYLVSGKGPKCFNTFYYNCILFLLILFGIHKLVTGMGSFLLLSLVATVSAASYSDDFSREKMFPLTAAAYSDTPQICLSRLFQNSTLTYRYLIVIFNLVIYR
uniref:Protein Wnt n=1 Tax=Heterorhabditis bacteriophora TaxID=37862 RepID=A0A1I7WE71_HETBA